MSDITLYPERLTERIKPLHGVNNGPVTYGSLVDVSDYFKSAGIPLVRLHDPNWPHPREVDIHIIFPDFSKDPSDPASYNFSQSDEYLRTVAETGARIVYRLGESIEHTKEKYFVHPPEDYSKWSDICIGIIRHYNEGWADGFHYGIEYWEIWNEPDYSIKMWSGTHEQYYALYETASVAIKAYNPSLKIGGPAVARPAADFVPEFLEYCRARKLPLDFFSWHTYTADPEKIVSHARHIRTLLDEYGFTKTESHLNEWNYLTADFATIWDKGNEYLRKETFDRQKNAEGASFVAQVLISLQDLPVDQANYYDAQPIALFCGMFDYHGVPQKTYFVFRAYEILRSFPYRMHCEISGEMNGVMALAAADGEGSAAVLISNFHPERRELDLVWTGLAETTENYMLQVYAIDEVHELKLVEEDTPFSLNRIVHMDPYSVLLLRISS